MNTALQRIKSLLSYSAKNNKVTRKTALPGCMVVLLVLLLASSASGQTFTPVPVTGFNQDVVAETGTSSLTTTSMALDAVPASNRVMYTNTFRITNAFGGGGLPDNGTITDAFGTYQLNSYTANNALLLQRAQSGDLTLTTPAKFSTIRVLGFTTEGNSLINVTLHFTDASTTNALVNYSLSDWFNSNTNLVLSGFGRCSRATPAASADGYPTNPRMYYVNIPLSCADKQKTLEKISFSNVTTGGTNAPYPNAVLLAVSGISTTPASISANITDAGCSSNGAVTLTIGNVLAPYTVTWNTIPVQTGPTATNLPAGTYQATIRDANGCDTVHTVNIALINNLTMIAHIDTSVCAGASFFANTISNAANFSWTPVNDLSNPLIANPLITPTANRLYTITGTTGSCSISKSFSVTFKEKAVAKFGYTINQCSSDPVQFSDSSVINGGSVNEWKWMYNGSIFNTIKNPARLFPQGTHTVRLVVNGPGGCESDTTDHTFTFNEKPAISMNFTDACKLTPVNFIASETSALGISSWLWLFGDGATATGNPVQHTYSNGNSYPVKLVGKAGNGCNSDTLRNTIIIYATNAFAGNDISTASGQPVQLQATGGVSYEWTPATGLNNPFIANPVATLSGSQIYTYVVRAYTPLGCDSYDTIKIQVYEAPEIYLPGAFVPGGTNNIYKALPVGIRDFKYMKIFNRYGQEIFYCVDAQVGWDGTWKGKALSSGVYVVIARGVDYRGLVVDRQASFVLVR